MLKVWKHSVILNKLPVYLLQHAEEVHDVLGVELVPVRRQSLCGAKVTFFWFMLTGFNVSHSCRRLLTLRQGLDDVQEAEKESLDLVRSQPAVGRHGAAAHGGSSPLQLQHTESATVSRQRLRSRSEEPDMSYAHTQT